MKLGPPLIELPFIKTSSYTSGSFLKICMFNRESSTQVQRSYIPSGKESTCEVSVISQNSVARSKSPASSSCWVVMTVVLQPEGDSPVL